MQNGTPLRAALILVPFACCYAQNLASEEHHRSEQDFQDFIRKFQEGEIFPYREQLRKNTGDVPNRLHLLHANRHRGG